MSGTGGARNWAVAYSTDGTECVAPSVWLDSHLGPGAIASSGYFAILR